MDKSSTQHQDLLERVLEHHSLSLAEVEKLTRIEFPKGTRLLNAERVVWQEEVLYVKLQMSEVAKEQFLNSPRFAGKFSDTDTRGVRNNLGWPVRWLSWWNPNAVESFLAAEDTVSMAADGSEVTKVLISYDSARKGTYLVYLYWVHLRH